MPATVPVRVLALIAVLAPIVPTSGYAQSPPKCDAPMEQVDGFLPALSPDGRYLASTIKDKGVRLVALADHRELGIYPEMVHPQFSPDGKRLLLEPQDQATVAFVDVPEKGAPGALQTMHFESNTARLSPGGRLIEIDDVAPPPTAAGQAPSRAPDQPRLLRAADRAELARFEKDSYFRLVAARDESVALVYPLPPRGAAPQPVIARLIDVASGKARHRFSMSGPIVSAALASDGSIVAISDSAATKLFDTASGAELASLPPAIRPIGFSRDGSRFLLPSKTDEGDRLFLYRRGEWKSEAAFLPLERDGYFALGGTHLLILQKGELLMIDLAAMKPDWSMTLPSDAKPYFMLPDGDVVVLARSGPTRPTTDLWLFDSATGRGGCTISIRGWMFIAGLNASRLVLAGQAALVFDIGAIPR